MHRSVRVTLVAAIVTAALSLAGCSQNDHKTSPAAEPSVPSATSSVVPARPTGPLPAPEALTDVLSRLADPGVPGANKLNLVEGSTPETAAALDRFTTAARDGGYLPMTFAANNLAWSDRNPSDVVATVVVTTAQPNNRQFTFPMEFTPAQGGWQLSRRTAEMLLALQNSRNSTPPSTPAPEPGPAPAPTPEPSPPESPAPAPAPPG
ncbi:hypothetical protein [Mycobacterium angelicum]|uniref:Low molecular weight antigen MTB12-like C-terminal domain-containing protein n=1 Tax=Mycobacterium angelicum TaxID=470074 RepID=A0A1W9ZGR7_MYCAN|nr:hypothetical protein [Mycobacterium angelicum]MCV7195733.1 hypothetical protein [Mycobacterium angelicum]ORA14682.1 hypothetical protein BST12_22720 [Mycobacterium angelicum]